MPNLFRPHYLIVFGGFIIGLLFGVFVLDTSPAIAGWLFGAGAGTTGGAFVAAIASGEQIIGGPAASRQDLEFDLDAFEREQPHPLDGLPPRREDETSQRS